jgi:hypothetical protein
VKDTFYGQQQVLVFKERRMAAVAAAKAGALLPLLLVDPG